MSRDGKGFESWAIVELMGHQQIAGLVTEQEIAGAALLRVDVPAVTREGISRPGHTKYFGTSAIYAIHPCTEDLAQKAAEGLVDYRSPLPVHVPDLAAALDVLRRAEMASRKLIPASTDAEWDEAVDQSTWDDPDDDLPL